MNGGISNKLRKVLKKSFNNSIRLSKINMTINYQKSGRISSIEKYYLIFLKIIRMIKKIKDPF